MQVELRTRFVRKKLIRKNMSQNWLAMKMDVSSGYMSQLMDGSRHPSPEVRRRLLDLFPECDFDDLFVIRNGK